MVNPRASILPHRGRGLEPRALCLAVLCALFGLFYGSKSSAGQFELETALPVVGDGVTEVTIPIKTSDGSSVPAALVRASVSAGTIRVKPDAKGMAQLSYLPPHIAHKWTANLDVTIAGFSPTLRSARIRLIPPARLLTYRKTKGEIGMELPQTFILGEHTEATLRITGIEEKPSLSVSVGRVSDLTPAGAGAWVATFSPPEGGFPQRVLVVVSAPDGNRLVFDQFDLFGRPSIETKSEPKATVKVMVGKQTFGPLQADSKGKLRLTVFAPPGVTEARVKATDSIGNARETRLALGAPDFNRLHIVCPEYSGRVLIFGTAPNGSPLALFPGKLTTSVGTLTEPVPVIPGYFESEITVPDGTDADTQLKLVALLPESPASVASCMTPVPGEAPTSSQLSLSSTEYSQGDGALGLTLKLTYPGKSTPRPVTVHLKAASGTVSEQVRVNATTYTAKWTPDAEVSSGSRIQFVAEVARTPALSANAVLNIAEARTNTQIPTQKNATLLARAGYLTNFGQVSSLFFAVGATMELRTLADGLALGVELGRFSSQRSARSDSVEPVTIKARGVPISTRVTYERPVSRFVPYAGVGVGIVLGRTEVSSSTIGRSTESNTVPLIRGLGGTVFDLKAGSVGLEGGYMYCPVSGNSTSGNLCGVDITATYHYSL